MLITGATTVKALSEAAYREIEVVAGRIFGSCFKRVFRVYSEGTQVTLRSATVQAFMYSSTADAGISIGMRVGYVQSYLTLEIELHDYNSQRDTMESIILLK